MPVHSRKKRPAAHDLVAEIIRRAGMPAGGVVRLSQPPTLHGSALGTAAHRHHAAQVHHRGGMDGALRLVALSDAAG